MKVVIGRWLFFRDWEKIISDDQLMMMINLVGLGPVRQN